MPTAGYCSQCKSNVWVTKEGACPAGHGAECISNRYEASPERPAGVTAPGAAPTAEQPAVPAAVPAQTAAPPAAAGPTSRTSTAATVQPQARAPSGNKWVKGVIIAGVILLVMALPLGFLGNSMLARAHAEETIGQAAGSVRRAEGAVGAGGPGSDKSGDAAVALDEAKQHLSQGSLFAPSGFAEADRDAEKAKLTADAVLRSVQKAFDDAGSADDPTRAYLDFAKQYPKSDLAPKALGKAEETLLSSTQDMEPADALGQMAAVVPLFPKDYLSSSSQIPAKAREILVAEADSSLTALTESHRVNDVFVKAMDGSGSQTGEDAAAFQDQSASPDDAKKLRQFQTLASQLSQPAEMAQLFGTLAVGTDASAKCAYTANHPSSKSSTDGESRLYTPDQIDSIREQVGIMKKQIDQAKPLLTGLQGKGG